MTVLEDEEPSVRNKLSLSKPFGVRSFYGAPSPQQQQYYLFPLKRRISIDDQDTYPQKKRLLEAMLNGYRSSDNQYRSGADAGHDCPVAKLSNMGNTCFLNSVLYTLRFSPTFLHNLHHLIGDLSLISSRHNQNKAKSSSLGRNVSSVSGTSSRSTSSKDLLALGTFNESLVSKPKVQIVTEKLHDVFMNMHVLEVREGGEAYQPSAFLQAVREANYIFEGNHQQDAHELLVYLFDNIRETCDIIAQQVELQPELLLDVESHHSSNLKSWRNSWKKAGKKKDKSSKEKINEELASSATDTEDASSVDGQINPERKRIGYNFVSEDFEGITLRRTKCLECESVTERKEPFYDIPVPIISTKEEDIEANPSDIYRKACVTSEKLCDSNKYLCENCRRYNEASREVSFEKLPNIMVLQLKRFTTTSSGVQKVNSYLPTPLELNCFCEDCCRLTEKGYAHHYELCCVILHIGASMASGHYIAYVRVTDTGADYHNCLRDSAKSASSSASNDKVNFNIIKQVWKPKSSTGADNKNGLITTSKSAACKGMECCGVKLNRNIVDNLVNNYSRRSNQERGQKESIWLECDDEVVRPISSEYFKELLSYKPNSTSTPYLLFYSKINHYY